MEVGVTLAMIEDDDVMDIKRETRQGKANIIEVIGVKQSNEKRRSRTKNQKRMGRNRGKR